MALTLTVVLEASDTRAAVAEALAVRDALAEMLERIAPHHMTVFGTDALTAEVELRAADAFELARDLVEELEARGLVIRRAGA